MLCCGLAGRLSERVCVCVLFWVVISLYSLLFVYVGLKANIFLPLIIYLPFAVFFPLHFLKISVDYSCFVYVHVCCDRIKQFLRFLLPASFVCTAAAQTPYINIPFARHHTLVSAIITIT